jgi:hypothetical protein
MTRKRTKASEPKLRRELGKLQNAQRDEIRRSYYQVADALPALATALELADLDTGESPGRCSTSTSLAAKCSTR